MPTLDAQCSVVISAVAGVLSGFFLHKFIQDLRLCRGEAKKKDDQLPRSEAKHDQLPQSKANRKDESHVLSPSPSLPQLPTSPTSSKIDPLLPLKREGALSWDDYFIALAFLSAQRSKDPNKQVGACIVSQTNIILSIGYNGFPRGIADDDLPWAKLSRSGEPLETKYPYVVHAEANAILNANTDKMTGQRIYVTMHPCNECAKLIIQAGIREVIYCEAKEPPYAKAQDKLCYEASRKLFDLAGVKVRQHCLKERVVIADEDAANLCMACESEVGSS